MSRFFTSGSPRPLLPPVQAARLDGWVAYLDVDLELAQRTLRLPVADLPPVPGLADPGPAPEHVPPAAAPARSVPEPVRELRGAYARRAKPTT